MKKQPQGQYIPGELDEVEIDELIHRLTGQDFSALELTDCDLDRIDRLDRRGPGRNSVIEINPDAREMARRIDREGPRRHGAPGPLEGIPILLKGNIDTGDAMETTAGSLALMGWRAREDAELVERLRRAGAVILGKTNLSEWANFRSTRSTSGWSSRGGLTKNPYILERNPCGSSSGSAVAVSANLCAAAVGTETDGSIICPSSVNGIVGLKPTVGMVSQRGIIPISQSQDTAGPMTRTVKDASLILSVLTDRYTPPATPRQPGGLDLKGIRIGVVTNYFGIHPEVDRLIKTALYRMEAAGAVLVETEFRNRNRFDEAEWEVMLYEFKTGIEEYLGQASVPGGIKTLEDLIKFNRDHAETVMPWFGQDILEAAVDKGPLTDSVYRRARKRCREGAGKHGIDRLIAKDKLNVLAAPSGGPAWKTDLITGDHHTLGSTSPAAAAGYPAITVPAGFIHRLPVGLSFFGLPWTEPELIQIAEAAEHLTQARRPPLCLTAP